MCSRVFAFAVIIFLAGFVAALAAQNNPTLKPVLVPVEDKLSLEVDNDLLPLASPEHPCENLEYTDYYGQFWLLLYPESFNGFRFSQRFDNPKYHTAYISGAALRIYDVENGGGDIRLYVLKDDNGQPGALLHLDTVPASTVVNLGPGHWLFPFSSTVAITDSVYHIAYSAEMVYDSAKQTYGVVHFGLNNHDNGTATGRSRFMDPLVGVWQPMSELGDPYNDAGYDNRILSEVCYDYNLCRTESGSTAGAPFLFPSEDGTSSEGTLTGFGQRLNAIYDTLKSVSFALMIDSDGVSKHYAGSGETNGLKVSVWLDDGNGSIDTLAGPLASRFIEPGVSNLFPVTGEDYAVAPYEWHTVSFVDDSLIFTHPFHVTVQSTGTDHLGGSFALRVDGLSEGGSVSWNSADSWLLGEQSTGWRELGNGSFSVWLEADLCQNEYNSCSTSQLWIRETAKSFRLGQECKAVAQKAFLRQLNTINQIAFQIADETINGGSPSDNEGTNPGGPDLRLTIYEDSTLYLWQLKPGRPIWDTLLAASQLRLWPEWNHIAVPRVSAEKIIWIGYELVTDDTASDGTALEWYNACTDDGPYAITGGSYYLDPDDQTWKSIATLIPAQKQNWMISFDYCWQKNDDCEDEDTDGDGVNNVCDVCTDVDRDGYGDPGFPANTCALDNCAGVKNNDQVDLNQNGIGDACESCCGFWTHGYTGNVDCSADGRCNLSDITRLIDYTYISMEQLCCEANGNVDGSLDDAINLHDITVLIDYIYITKKKTAPCL